MKKMYSLKIVLFTLFFNQCNNPEQQNSKKENHNTILILQNDTLNGDRLYIYPSGKFWGFEKFSKGVKHGDSYFFYESGNMKSHWVYHEGKPDGHCYNYGDSYIGYPMEFLVYGGNGQLVFRRNHDSTGKVISEEGGVPRDWLK